MIIETAVKAIAGLTLDLSVFCGKLDFLNVFVLWIYGLLTCSFASAVNHWSVWTQVLRTRALSAFTQHLQRFANFERVVCVKNLQLVVSAAKVSPRARATSSSSDQVSVLWQDCAADNFARFVVDLLQHNLITSEALTSSCFALLNSDQCSSLIRLFCRVMRSVVARFADVSDVQVPDVFLSLLQTVESVSHSDDGPT